ncbi:hypothetical protein UFOVP699_204 [uncultured Caudovirales phage]|uniref:Uncharacterized protein n=1 Tax=uncultured Caudovirales phage TaxID=2100421 RepID=A0A6J5NQV5_9CAUD|nr:hypothetical protein UFOVP699_204 [uncultured Caudovirales phage]
MSYLFSNTFIPKNTDSFGRTRVSEPFTLFDSNHRYSDNQLWSSATATGGTATFNSAQGLVDLSVTAASGSEVLRETTKVFAYQPGKSLLVLSTFVMAPAKTNLRQRIGYYGASNGYYLEQNNTTVSFVERSFVTGSVVNTPVVQENWNVDPMNGSGPSGITLDLTKSQILFMDLEWLGVGTVRIGFVINGEFHVCHKFHHANLITSTYITTASLPLRYEITNTGATSGISTLKQICSTVISEGGYTLNGLQQAIGIPLTAPRNLPIAGTFYPIVSIRLKASPDRLDGLIICTAISAMATSTGNYNWQLIASGTTTDGSWLSAGPNSSAEYNITGTSFTGGRILASGFFSVSNQGSTQVDILKEALFKTQLERNGLTSSPFELTIVVASDAGGGGGNVLASMDWEEITR